jgi:endoglucanase
MAYNINGHNYFMLRDIAYVVRNSPAVFDVGWDASRNAIMLSTGIMYTLSREYAGNQPPTVSASPSTALVYVNGNSADIRAYNIGGHNYFMLRDLGEILNFIVDFDANTNTVIIKAGGREEPDIDEPVITPAPTATPVETPTETPAPTAPPATVDGQVSAREFVLNLGPGWNLGNHFDAHSHGAGGFHWIGDGTYANSSLVALETAWVRGVENAITRNMLEQVKDAGFTSIRIPVTWYKVAPAPNYTIRPEWMARVREVVQWAYDMDMHIILNTHHDETQAMDLTNAGIDQSVRMLTVLWEQIAKEFNGYSDRLIFAGLNEPRIRNTESEWTGGTPEVRNNINRLNQAFVDTVRATGGNNATRFLIVPTHGASASNAAFEGFTIPRDTAHDRMILAVHTYSPFAWAHDGRGEYTNSNRICTYLNRVAENATRLGVPVILSEWGSVDNGTDVNIAQRVQHATDYVSIAREHGMATFWWDSGNPQGGGAHAFHLFNRRTGAKLFPQVIDAILKAHE